MLPTKFFPTVILTRFSGNFSTRKIHCCPSLGKVLVQDPHHPNVQKLFPILQSKIDLSVFPKAVKFFLFIIRAGLRRLFADDLTQIIYLHSKMFLTENLKKCQITCLPHLSQCMSFFPNPTHKAIRFIKPKGLHVELPR